MTDRATVPRGRHAPPLEVRLSVQRRRLLEAAAAEFARSGYADASAEAISRAAGMSKATFYEHFSNKEECILALWDDACLRALDALVRAARSAGSGPPPRHPPRGRAILPRGPGQPGRTHPAAAGMGGAGPP